jgi:hypothetical protein
VTKWYIYRKRGVLAPSGDINNLKIILFGNSLVEEYLN